MAIVTTGVRTNVRMAGPRRGMCARPEGEARDLEGGDRPRRRRARLQDRPRQQALEALARVPDAAPPVGPVVDELHAQVPGAREQVAVEGGGVLVGQQVDDPAPVGPRVDEGRHPRPPHGREAPERRHPRAHPEPVRRDGVGRREQAPQARGHQDARGQPAPGGAPEPRHVEGAPHHARVALGGGQRGGGVEGLPLGEGAGEVRSPHAQQGRGGGVPPRDGAPHGVAHARPVVVQDGERPRGRAPRGTVAAGVLALGRRQEEDPATWRCSAPPRRAGTSPTAGPSRASRGRSPSASPRASSRG